MRETSPLTQRDQSKEAGSTESVPAPMVERAFRLLDLVAASEVGYSLSELARMLGMSKGSVFGLLRTLERAGAVEVDEDRRYALGPRVYHLAESYIRRSGLRRFALPAMQRLAARTGETVFLGQVESDSVRIVELVEGQTGRTALRLSARRGAYLHLLAGATGRVVLAGWPPERRQEYLERRELPHFTEHSLTGRDQYLAAVRETERTGIGIDHDEYLVGVSAVAAGITGLDSELLALIWIAGFSATFTDDALQRAGEALLEETRAISRALGAHR